MMFGKKPGKISSSKKTEQKPSSPVLESTNSDDKKLFSGDASQIEGYVHHADKPEITFTDSTLETETYQLAKKQLTELMLEKVDFSTINMLADDIKKQRIKEACGHIIHHDIQTPLTSDQVDLLKEQAVDDLLGFGPIEVLLDDSDIADIMINGHQNVFIEKDGRIMRTDIRFSSERHLINVIQKIISIVGRRIDESSPMVDARMPDGSRFNAIIPPLALDGSLVSIRKFRKQKIMLDDYVKLDSMSEPMSRFLSICGEIRLNMIISGGTGSGKTTLLNAISGTINKQERIITIEDAAELQLQQPHVLRMESRPPNMEGVGEVTQRQLVRNALRMRPDRIIIGEMRGDEVVEVLSAMNTGHDGSMATMHANSPRDALSRVENLIGMSSVSMSVQSLRNQIASAIQLVVQISRQRDGKRRVVQIDEIIGLDGDNIQTQTIFVFKPDNTEGADTVTGTYEYSGIEPAFLQQAAYFGKAEELMQCLKTV